MQFKILLKCYNQDTSMSQKKMSLFTFTVNLKQGHNIMVSSRSDIAKTTTNRMKLSIM